MLFTPDTGNSYSGASAVNAPYSTYNLDFTADGSTWYAWVYFGASSASQGIFLAVDGDNAVLVEPSSTSPSWSTQVNLGAISSGAHDLNLLIRDMGIYVEKIVLTTNVSYNPAIVNGGDGPAVTPGGPEGDYVTLTVDADASRS